MQRRSKAQANGTPSPAAAAAAKTRAHERKMREARREAGDVGSIALLGLLYVIQGIPLGLHASVPFILQSRTTYADQAVLALASWPFSLKLLWAPIVDGVYVRSFGRRKTWLVPVQVRRGVRPSPVPPRPSRHPHPPRRTDRRRRDHVVRGSGH